MEGNASHVSLQASSRLDFRERYMRRFLPLLSCVREKSAMKRYKAVKKAADLSLACTAGRTIWSKALCRSLFAQTASRKQRRSFGPTANEAGLAFLKRLRKRRRWARAQALNYRKSYSRARRERKESIKLQRGHKDSNLQATLSGKLAEAQATNEPRMVTQCGNFEADKLSCLSELIPGGLHMDLPKLLDQTAHYIISLQLQVDALSFLGRAFSA